ncbi:unnamed protein product [Rangifer tarandus platyrhynchus]|uniref:Uncharacterized protein n=2 Tax=Rangifer tarandus platyrhynchus TaxID=3082113 RepID=A0ABN8YWK4_RANTA|nr:unnamed protein product [Rangifer tarandus platyrhynchus]CAI9693754.1 unnamed protein product [Rangifer tarandus platyrhynchus]
MSMNKGRKAQTNEGTTVISLPCHAVGLATPDSSLHGFKVQRLRSDALTSKRRGEKSCRLWSPEAGFPVVSERLVSGLCTGSVHEGSNPSPTLGRMIRAKLPILLPKSMERFPIHPAGQSKISANRIDARYPEAFSVPGHLSSWDRP